MSGFLVDLGHNFHVFHYTQKSVMRHTHTHPHYELYLCVENVGQKSVINGMEYDYRYPCAILSTPYTIHSMSCDDDAADTFDRFVFYFDGSLFKEQNESLFPQRLLHRNIGLLFPLTVEQADFLKKFLTLSLFSESPPTDAERALCLGFLLNKLFDFCPEESLIQVGTTSFYLQDVLQFVAERVQTPPSVEEIAQRFSVSRSKLDRDFKRYTGRTLHHYIELCRLNHAKYLLQRSKNYSVNEIAALCGFSGETYFFPFFKKYTGQTPIEFRNAARSDNRSPDDR